jgi:hypothetical protein
MAAEVGRPTKYQAKYCKAIIEYFKECVVVERIVDDPSGRGGTNTHFETVRVPSIVGFASSIGVHRDTLYEWAQATYPKSHKLRGKLKHPEFSDALSHAQSLEESIIFEYGMAGYLDRGLAALYFTNKLGYKDSKHLDMTSDGERLQTAPVVVSAIAARQIENAPAQPEAS